MFRSLGISGDATHLSDALLPKLSLPALHLLDIDLSLKIIWFDLADELLMGCLTVLWVR